jgi:hypothetical protein
VPAYGAPKRKKTTARNKLAIPIAEIMTINRLARRTPRDEITSPTVNNMTIQAWLNMMILSYICHSEKVS